MDNLPIIAINFEKWNYRLLSTLCLIFICIQIYSQTWVKKNPIHHTNDLNTVTFIDDLIGYAAGSNGTIVKTIDGGNNWVSLQSGTTNRLYDITFTNSTTGFVVGDVGTVLKTTDSGLTSGIKGKFAKFKFTIFYRFKYRLYCWRSRCNS